VPQQWIVGPTVLTVFLNDLDGGPECTLSKSASDTKVGEVVDTPDRFAAIQRNLHKLE